MKKVILALMLVATINVAAQSTDSETRSIGTFTEVFAGKGINVTLIEGDKESIKVEIKNADLSDVITELKGRRLEIKMKTKIYNKVAVQVYVTYQTIKAIQTGTGASVDAEDVITAENLDLKAGSGSSIILDIDTKTVTADLSSSKVELIGETQFQDITANTGSKYTGDQLECKDTFVKVATGATAWVNAEEKLEAKATTGGKVIYKGDPAKLIMDGNVSKDE